MVFITKLLFAGGRKPRKYMQLGLRDSLKLFVSGGSGGNGLPKFGGVGGQGGSVTFVANENITLQEVFRQNRLKRYEAKNGTNSSANFILGLPGENITLSVPIGITVYTTDGKKLGELNEEGQELLVAEGGVGGNPKNGFIGRKGDAHHLVLDLKLIADIGLVGFPNAGKSTLLKAISNAKPKIASYPFTTIRPNIGTMMYKDERQITMADLPGLIEGAYANKGMGHRFLKHVERTKLLLLVVDINGFQLSPLHPHRNCLENILLLNKEMELYNEDLIDKPAMLLINKMDMEDAHEKYDEIKDKVRNLSEFLNEFPEEFHSKKMLTFSDIMTISAKENPTDTEKVKLRLREILDINEETKCDLDEENVKLHDKIESRLREKHSIII